MLTGAGFGNDTRFAHSKCQKDLTDRVVDLMSPGQIEIFALEPDLSAAAGFRQAFRKIQRIRTAHIVAQQGPVLFMKLRIAAGFLPRFRQLIERIHERFGDVATPEFAKASSFVRNGTEFGGGRRHGIDGFLTGRCRTQTHHDVFPSPHNHRPISGIRIDGSDPAEANTNIRPHGLARIPTSISAAASPISSLIDPVVLCFRKTRPDVCLFRQTVARMDEAICPTERPRNGNPAITAFGRQIRAPVS